MERTPWISRWGALAVAACGLLLLCLVAWEARAADDGAPKLVDVDFDPPAIVGRTAGLRVAAEGGAAPVAGMEANFGRGQTFGLSACRSASRGRRLRPPFAPGSRVRLTAPHVFRDEDEQPVLVRLAGAGCDGPVRRSARRLTVRPARQGQRPRRPFLDPADLPVEVPTALDARRRCPNAGRLPGRSKRSEAIVRGALLCMLNVQRRAAGLRPLRQNRRLLAAARAHSVAMVNGRFFSHTQPNGKGLVDRVRKTAYLSGVRRWLVGENIGYGKGRAASPRGMVRSWMRSTGHRANILNGRFTDVGLGVVRGVPGHPGSRGATYTTDFGRRG